MATISFSNGQNVEFNGTPTQQDVEEIAGKMGLHQPVQPAQPQTYDQSHNIQPINAGGAIKDAFKSGVGQIKQSFAQASAAKNPLQAINSGITFGAGVVNTALSPLAPIFKPVSDLINTGADKISNVPAVQNFAMSKAGQATAQGAETIGNLSTIAGGAATAMEVPRVTGLLTDTAKSAANTVAGAVRDTASEVRGARAVGESVANTQKVSDMVTPKPTIKEVRLAQAEGRLVKGKPATLLRSQTPDTILPSQKSVSATQTIINNIPNAAKMNPAELYNAVDSTITKTAESLKPDMKATPIKPETIQGINDTWGELKKSQIADAPATEEANVAKRQGKFEDFLRKSGNESQNDLWETRVSYDKSIPNGVKKANVNSPESLQLQKTEWLQNRAILNKAITDTVSGMGEKAQAAFKAMTDLYEAKNGLQSRARLETKLEPSGIKKAYNSKPGKLIRGAAKIGTAGKILGL